jgi:type IV pilus assembly protein PilO
VERTDRNILVLGLLVVLLIVVGYYFLFLGPLLDRLGERSEERSAKEGRLVNLRHEVAELEAVQRNAPETERQLLELSKRVPTQPEIPTLVVQMEDVADAAGVTQLSIQPGTPGPPPGGSDYSVVPVTMSFEGTYEQLVDFLRRTGQLARLVTVNGVTYEEATQESTALQEIEQVLQVEVEVEVYFQPSVEPSDVPSGSAPAAPVPSETTTDTQEEATDAQ